MSLLLNILDDRQVDFNRLRVFLFDANAATAGGDTLFGVTWNVYNNSEIHIYLRDHVSETQLFGTLLHETAHSLVNTTENAGHTDEWFRVTVRLMMLINMFLPETEHFLCAAIRGENVCTAEDISGAIVLVE